MPGSRQIWGTHLAQSGLTSTIWHLAAFENLLKYGILGKRVFFGQFLKNLSLKGLNFCVCLSLAGTTGNHLARGGLTSTIWHIAAAKN